MFLEKFRENFWTRKKIGKILRFFMIHSLCIIKYDIQEISWNEIVQIFVVGDLPVLRTGFWLFEKLFGHSYRNSYATGSTCTEKEQCHVRASYQIFGAFFYTKCVGEPNPEYLRR